MATILSDSPGKCLGLPRLSVWDPSEPQFTEDPLGFGSAGVNTLSRRLCFHTGGKGAEDWGPREAKEREGDGRPNNFTRFTVHRRAGHLPNFHFIQCPFLEMINNSWNYRTIMTWLCIYGCPCVRHTLFLITAIPS